MPPPPPPPLPLRYASGSKKNDTHKVEAAAAATEGVPAPCAPRFEEFDVSPKGVSGAFENLPAHTFVSQTQEPVVATAPFTSVTSKHIVVPPRLGVGSTHTPPSSYATSSTQQVAHLLQLVQDLTAENAVLQQRTRVLMEGETRDDVLPGIPTSHPPLVDVSEEREALLLRIRRLEAALKVEAMEREALEMRLQAQERVLTRLLRR